MSTTMKVPLGMRKLLLAAMSMAVILWSSVGSYGETRRRVDPYEGPVVLRPAGSMTGPTSCTARR